MHLERRQPGYREVCAKLWGAWLFQYKHSLTSLRHVNEEMLTYRGSVAHRERVILRCVISVIRILLLSESMITYNNMNCT